MGSTIYFYLLEIWETSLFVNSLIKLFRYFIFLLPKEANCREGQWFKRLECWSGTLKEL